MGDGMVDFFLALEETLLFEVFEDFFATLFDGKAGVFIRDVGHGAVFGYDFDAKKIVAFSNLEIIKVVGGSNLYDTSAVLWIGVFVSDDGDGSIGQW